MEIDLPALLTFSLITTFTPGPNTISSAAMALQHGYRRSLPYMLGIVTGFFLMMLASAILSTLLGTLLPSVMWYMKILGALYILYLAYHTLKSSYALQTSHARALGYVRGMLLQLLNPKVIILGLTVYSSFLSAIPKTFVSVPLVSLLLALMSFSAITVWAKFGSIIGKSMQNERRRRVVSSILALLLAYTALSLLLAKHAA